MGPTESKDLKTEAFESEELETGLEVSTDIETESDASGDLKPSGASILREEWAFVASVITTVLFLLFGDSLLSGLSNPLWFAVVFIGLFSVILASAFAIVRHAESLAIILGEPIGTLVLTLSVSGIEVLMISAVMLAGQDQPTIGRDTMFSVVMTLLGGMTGISLLVGGLRHDEQ